MFYVYIRILLIAERQNREIKQLESHLRFNGANYRNSAPAVHAANIGSTNLDARSSTTNITTNSLPMEHTRHLIQQHPQQTQQNLQPQIQVPNLDVLLHNMVPNCAFSCHCHCNQTTATTNPNQISDNKKDVENPKNVITQRDIQNSKNTINCKDLKDLNKNSKDANNNTEQLELDNLAKSDATEHDLTNEKSKPISNRLENRLQRRSKYISKQFDVTLLNSSSLEGKENEQEGDKSNQENSIRKENSNLTQSTSTPTVLESSDLKNDLNDSQTKRTNSNPNLNQVKSDESDRKNSIEKPVDLTTKQEELNQLESNPQDLTKQPINLQPHNHCCCFNQHLIYCAHQLHTKMIQQQQIQQQQIPQQQPKNLNQIPQQQQQISTTINPLTFAQNLLNILATNFPPLSEHSAEQFLDGYSSTSTSTLNNLNAVNQHQQQQLIPLTNENTQNLTGINIQLPSQAINHQPQQNSLTNQINALQQFNQFLQQNNLTNLICSHPTQSPSNSNQNQSTPSHNQITTAAPICQSDHQTCCSSNLINCTNRKCSDTSTVSGPVASCSSVATKSMCSSNAGAHCHLHYPHSIHSLPIYSTVQIDNPATIQFPHQANVQFDLNSLTGLHQARSNSGSSIAVLDEIKRAERQLRKRSKQILTDTKAIRTLGIVMGVFCACWLPFFIIYVVSFLFLKYS